MIDRTTFHAVPALSDLGALRQRYLDELPKAQDALLEAWVAESAYHVLEVDGERAGYAISSGTVLLEYFVRGEHEGVAHLALPTLVEALGLTSALVKTFDHLFMACALDLQKRVTVKGVLVRDLHLRELPPLSAARYAQRTATLDDLDRVVAVEQDVFTHPERLRRVIAGGFMQLFEREDGALLGFGIARPVLPDRPDAEIGVALDAKHRSQGYAPYVLRDLVTHCLSRGLNPICGCSRSNEPSIRTGSRIGFTGRYRLLEIHFR